jgi:myo-inositol-1(or 4)-monophosphatase
LSELRYVPAASEIAREAGKILLQHLGHVAIEYKGGVDLVTAADRASEAFIVARLRQLFPTHSIVAEEGGGSEASSGYRWYVDPLDGTTNFAHRIPFFAVSLGLEYEGRMIAGVVYNPVLNELFAAEEGHGATLNGQPIHVSPTAMLAESLVGTGFPVQKRNANPNIHFYHMLTLHSHGVRRMGAAALDLCYTACGRLEAFWEFNLKPWDTAAGSFIVQQAGGTVTDILGQPFSVHSPEVLASNGLVHREMLDLFGKIFAGKTSEIPSASAYLEARGGQAR